MKRLGGIVLISVMIFLWAAVAAGAEQVEITVDGDPPWKIYADRITAEGEEEIFLADGCVRIVRNGETIEADRARLHVKTQMAEFQGDVVITSPDFKVVCKRLAVNFELDIGKIYDGAIFFKENHYYLIGDVIERTGPQTFRVLGGRATSCDGPFPAWSLTGEEIYVENEGYATARNARFNTRYMPLMFLPWLKIPLRTRRQSGFLVPEFRQSTNNGVTVTQPFFWALSDSKDITFYTTYMSSRGVSPTVEARYNDWGGKGMYFFTYLADQEPPTIEYDEPTGTKTVEDRYWLRGMSNIKTEGGFDIKIDLDMVSDPRYLYSFRNGMTGFYDTNERLYNEFGRELAEPLDPLRKSVFHATKTGDHQHMEISMEYTDNLEDPENRDTIQRLPRISLDHTRLPIGESPIFFANNAEYTYFGRKTDQFSRYTEQGHRLDFHPRVYMPFRLFQYLHIEPSLGFRETLYMPYDLDQNNTGLGATGDDYRMKSRELFDIGMTASTNFSRVYDLGWAGIPKLKHRLQPEVEYKYVSKQNQAQLPYWDSMDRIPEEHKVRYGIVNYLIAKMKNDPKYPQACPPNGTRVVEPPFQYMEFLRIGVHRSYDFVEERRELRDLGIDWLRDARQPHSPWEFELEAQLPPYFWVYAASDYDVYAEAFSRHAVEFRAKDKRGDFLHVAYEYNREPHFWKKRNEEEYEEIKYLINLAVNDELNLQFDHRYSIMHNTSLETVYSVNYQPQCWGVRVEYSDSPEEKAFGIFFTLTGLGEVAGYRYASEKTEDARVVTTTSD